MIQELDRAIRELLQDSYNLEYIGKLKIEELNPVGYCVTFYMNGEYEPMTIYGELEYDKFLKFLKDEIRRKSFHLSVRGVLNKVEPYDERRAYRQNRSCCF